MARLTGRLAGQANPGKPKNKTTKIVSIKMDMLQLHSSGHMLICLVFSFFGFTDFVEVGCAS